jgi:hypothetical protein
VRVRIVELSTEYRVCKIIRSDYLLFPIFDEHPMTKPSFTVHSHELQKRTKMEPDDSSINLAMVRLVKSFSFL